MYGIKKIVSTLSNSTFASALSLMCRISFGHKGKGTTSPSAIKEHLSSCTTCKDYYSCNSFKVIDSANSDFEVSIKEALYIKHKNTNLNKQLSTQGMSFMLKIFT